MFARRETHKHAIPLAGQSGLTDEYHEVARFWVSQERSFVIVAPDVVRSPRLLGSLLVESLHTAATGYAQLLDMPEADALAELWVGFDEERSRLSENHADKDTE